jgi:hypothetical protein
LVCVGVVSGCATAGGGDDSTSDGGTMNPTDGAPKADANCPTGKTGAGCSMCSGGFHKCGNDCVQDLPNNPDAGCSKSCGGGCMPPANSTGQCTSDGVCDFVCNASYDKSDAGCECPMGQLDCMGTCQQCCQNSDCGNHVVCNGGTCGGCEQGWGDCNNNMSDGCETQLNSNSNCGACGNGCCSSFCGCGFLGIGGKSCKPSGQSYSCQC